MREKRDKRWWPINPYPHPMRSVDVSYAALGPSLTNQLVRLFDEFKKTGARFNDEIEQFIEELRLCDGRPPEMLFLMAASIAALAERLQSGDEFKSVTRELVQDSLLMDESFKLFGSLIVDAAQAFDMSPADLVEFISKQREHYDESSWPPRDRYYSQEPSGHDVVQFSTEVEKSLRDPLAFWLSLRDKPSLIGAHLVDIDDLYRYREKLQEGLANVDQDLEIIDESEREEAKKDLVDAVDMISDAIYLIRDAQDIIVRHFPT